MPAMKPADIPMDKRDWRSPQETALYVLGISYDNFMRRRAELVAKFKFPSPIPGTPNYDLPTLKAWKAMFWKAALAPVAGMEESLPDNLGDRLAERGRRVASTKH